MTVTPYTSARLRAGSASRLSLTRLIPVAFAHVQALPARKHSDAPLQAGSQGSVCLQPLLSFTSFGYIGCLLVTLFLLCSTAAQARPFAEGVDYRRLPQALAGTSHELIEVNTLFWYGCPHCLKLDILEQRWQQTLPNDVSVSRVPAVFGRDDSRWKQHARLFYTLERLDLGLPAHMAVFYAVQRQRMPLGDAAAVTDFLHNRFGANADRVQALYRSFPVSRAVFRAFTITKQTAITGVPVIIVDGRYVVEAKQVGSIAKMLPVVDYLIDTVRQQRQQQRQEAGPEEEDGETVAALQRAVLSAP